MADYDEMQNSWDEYGYAMMEFSTVGKPEVMITRHTGGDDFGPHPQRFTAESIRDEFTIGGDNVAPQRPKAELPESPVVQVPDPVLFAPYSDVDNEQLLEAHWQVRPADGAWSEPLYDVWGSEARNVNVWWDRNINEGIENEYWRVPALAEGGYCWRVRHRDEHWAWSKWSKDACFTVSGLTSGPDLVANGGAEEGTAGWTVEGRLEAVNTEQAPAVCTGDAQGGFGAPSTAPPAAHRGAHFFSLGGCTSPVARASATQDIDVSEYADAIDAGRASGVLRAATRTFTKWDIATVRFLALDGAGETLDVSRPLVNQSCARSQRNAYFVGARGYLMSSPFGPPG